MSSSRTQKDLRRIRHPSLTLLVDTLRERGMGEGMRVFFEDKYERFGNADLFSTAYPVSFSGWTGLKHRKGGKPRGLSVNKGNREWMNES